MKVEELPARERDVWKSLRNKVQKFEEENPGYQFLEYVLLLPDMFHLLG